MGGSCASARSAKGCGLTASGMVACLCEHGRLLCAGEEREGLGRCVAGLTLCAERAQPAETPAGRDAWLYDFARADALAATPSCSSASSSSQGRRRGLADCCLNEGDMVLLSIEGAKTSVYFTSYVGYVERLKSCLPCNALQMSAPVIAPVLSTMILCRLGEGQERTDNFGQRRALACGMSRPLHALQ
jgi:hypothetical protein